jgi:hypothetical protein
MIVKALLRDYFGPLVIALAVLGSAIGAGYLITHTTVYNAPGNAGIVIGVPCVNVGFEWRGTPGPIVDTCD